LTIRPKRVRLSQAVFAALSCAAMVCLELLALSVPSDQLFVRRASAEIHVTAPRLHFLTQQSLQRLHDGAVVPFDFQLTIAAGSKNTVVTRALERFTISYDVWQEKFAVTRLRDFRKSSLNLSANAAETWCLDNIFVPASGVPADRELWARLEVRSVDARPQASAARDSSISLATLIEIFSRNPRPQQEHWSLESPAFHLSDLKP
jgi:hypothetical protein